MTSKAAPGARPDTWNHLRQYSSARLALGRAGGSIPTGELLAFRLAHARAQDAVHTPLRVDEMAARLAQTGLDVVILASAARDRSEYLLRPDLGRRLAADAAQQLHKYRTDDPVDVALIVSDGLSAAAVHQHAGEFVDVFVAGAAKLRWRLGPLVLVRGGRVAIQDEIGSVLAARAALIVLGERPGLGTAESLGAYLVYAPTPGKSDADRNCLSNLHSGGLAPGLGAAKALYLLQEALVRGISGVQLKDEGGALLP